VFLTDYTELDLSTDVYRRRMELITPTFGRISTYTKLPTK